METHTAPTPAAAGATKSSDLISVAVAAITPLARDTNAYTFRRPDGAALPPYKAGAHIDVHLPNGLTRQFSLVHPAAADPLLYVVGIKRDPASRGGTSYIFDQLKIGDMLKISPPRNNFPLANDTAPAVLFAGGIGITPIWCMAQELAALARPWTLHYSCRSRSDMAFLSELERLGPERVQLHFDDEAEGRLFDLAGAIAAAPPDAHLYCCGPTSMLKAFQAAAAGRPGGHVHLEYFTPKEDAAGAGRIGGFWVELARSGEEYFIPEGKKILEVLYAAGVDVDYSCEIGICGACETRVISGIPEHHDSVLSEEDQASNTKVMICCAGSKSERLVLDL